MGVSEAVGMTSGCLGLPLMLKHLFVVVCGCGPIPSYILMHGHV